MIFGKSSARHGSTSSPLHRRHLRLGLTRWKPKSHKAFRSRGHSFPCMYRDAKGTLFATSDGISFVGKSLFFQQTIHIHWKDILEIVKNEKMSIGSAPSISILAKKSMHDFTKVQKPERTLRTLISLYNESLHGSSDISTTSSEEVDSELQDEWNQLQQDESYSKHAIQVCILQDSTPNHDIAAFGCLAHLEL